VDFIVRRESTREDRHLGLWKLNTHVLDETMYEKFIRVTVWALLITRCLDFRYCHLITDASSPVSEDALGGIFADDMGLGKTLTMIAAIASTRQESEKFEADLSDSSSRVRTRTTLVIVPSSCKLIFLTKTSSLRN
jgi:hypothetical protein